MPIKTVRPYYFETYPDAAGGFRWRFVAGNGLIMADSGESYTRLPDAIRAIRQLTRMVRRGMAPPDILMGLRSRGS